jgi:hypothetical protein
MKYSFCLAFLVVVACSSPKQQNSNQEIGAVELKPIEIELTTIASQMSEITLRDFTDTVIYVPLEANSNSMLGKIKELELTDKYIFVNDFSKVLQFDRNGKFIRQVGSNGKGPNEYLKVSTFTVSNEKQQVFIKPHYTHNLIIFDFDGNVITSIDDYFEKYCNKLFFIEPDIIVYSNVEVFFPNFGSEPEKVILVAKRFNGEILLEVPFDFSQEKKPGMSNTISLAANKSNDKLFFKKVFNDTIYTLNKTYDGIVMHAVAKGFNINLENIKNSDHFLRVVSENYRVSSFFDTGNYFFVDAKMENNGSVKLIIWDKQKGNYYTLEGSSDKIGLKNDIDNFYWFYPKKFQLNNLVAWVESYQMVEYINEPSNKEFKLPTSLRNITSSDNPIVIISPLR